MKQLALRQTSSRASGISACLLQVPNTLPKPGNSFTNHYKREFQHQPDFFQLIFMVLGENLLFALKDVRFILRQRCSRKLNKLLLQNLFFLRVF